MECNKAKEMLNDYLDKELAPEESAQVVGHLAVCASCREELAGLKKVQGLLKSLPRYQAPAELVAKLESACQPTGSPALMRGQPVEPQPFGNTQDKLHPADRGQPEPAPQSIGLLWRLRWALPPLATAAAVTLVVYISLVSMPQYNYRQPEAVTAVTEKMNNRAVDAPGLLPDELNNLELRARLAEEPSKDRLVMQEKKANDEKAPAPAAPPGAMARSGDAKLAKVMKSKMSEDKAKAEEYKESESAGEGFIKQDEGTKLQDEADDKDSELMDKAFSGGSAVGAQKGGRGKEMMRTPSVNEQPKAVNRKLYQVAKDTSAVWYLDELTEIVKQAQPAKRLVVVYFYFSNKDYFPKNRDDVLMRYSLEQALFTKIFVRTENTGKISDPVIDDLFTRHKLAHSAQCVVLDYYGNLVHKVTPPLATNKITAAIDEANKKVADIEASLNKDYARAEESAQNGKPSGSPADKGKLQEQIKLLHKILNTGYRGYAVIEQARSKLDEINQQALATRDEILKNYMEVDEDDQEPDKAIKELESAVQNYKGLPAEKELKDNIKEIKGTKSPGKK